MVGPPALAIPPDAATLGYGFRLADGHAYIRGPAALQLPLLTIGSLGTQIVWSVEMAYGTPYLLELGLSKSAMAVVFVAGPISGLVVQPIIGMMADKSTHPWGRRRPYLVAASSLCAFFVLLLGFSRVLADLFALPGATLVLTIVGIWGLDFAVNAVMALDRTLILDILPADRQAGGNAWCARLAAIGSILGFFVGDVDLANTFPFTWLQFLVKDGTRAPSEPQVRCLCLITAGWMLFTHAIVCFVSVERRLEYTAAPSPTPHRRFSLRRPLRIVRQSLSEFAHTAQSLSLPIKEVFAIQICSWICWFPMLFYSTEWISTTSVAAYLAAHSGISPDLEKIRAAGTRAGSHAMFQQALLSFVCSIVLPLLLPSAASRVESGLPLPQTTNGFGPTDHHRRKIWLAPTWLPPVLQVLVEKLRARILSLTGASAGSDGTSPGKRRGGFSLTSIWITGHLLLAVVTWLTWLMTSLKSLGGAIAIITIVGYSWAITQWAPFTLLGIFIQSGVASLEAEHARQSGGYEVIPLVSETAAALNGQSHRREEQREDMDAHGHKSSEDTVRPSLDGMKGSRSRNGHSHANSDDEDDDDDDESDVFFEAAGRSSMSLSYASLSTSTSNAALGLGSQAGPSPQTRRSMQSNREPGQAEMYPSITLESPARPAHASHATVNGRVDRHSHDAGDPNQAGTILGLHNIAIVIPQLIVSLLAALIFALFEPDRSTKDGQGPPGHAGMSAGESDAVGYVFRVGGIFSVAAAVLTWRLGKRWGRVIDGGLTGESR